MDETSYSDDETIRLINEEFIPVRVDRDRRPDVDSRYNMGGWPTIAILDSEGNIISGATYVGPETLKPWLRRVLSARRGGWAPLNPVRPDREPQRRPADKRSLETPYSTAVRLMVDSYDREFGGFGREPKFPMVDALELALAEYLRTQDPSLRKIFENTLTQMAEGRIYDRVEGGFFRYSTTRDWSVPHYEKMLDDNAALLGILAKAYAVTKNKRFTQAAHHILDYLEKTLYVPEINAFAGSQDADEEYYSLDAEARKKRGAPFVDRTIFTDWNSKAARALIEATWFLGEERWARLGVAILDSLASRSYKAGMGFAHYLRRAEDGTWTPELWGLLIDQISFGRGALAAFQETGSMLWLTLAEELAEFCLYAFRSENGGFLDVLRAKVTDRVPNKIADMKADMNKREAAGAPVEEPGPAPAISPLEDFQIGALTSRFLCELAALTEESSYLSAAREALGLWEDEFKGYGALAAGYGLAIGEALFPWTIIRIPGNPEDPRCRELVSRANSLFRPRKVVLPYQEEIHDDAVRGLGYEPRDRDAFAYICVGERCLPPAATAQELEDLLAQPHSSSYIQTG